MRKINFVSEIFPSIGGGAQSVHGGVDDTGAGFLVVEDGEGRGYYDGEEDGDGAYPVHSILCDICMLKIII